LFTGVRIAPAAAAIVRPAPERPFFRGANRSEAPAVPSLGRGERTGRYLEIAEECSTARLLRLN
jgi:hypothetical protein